MDDPTPLNPIREPFSFRKVTRADEDTRELSDYTNRLRQLVITQELEIQQLQRGWDVLLEICRRLLRNVDWLSEQRKQSDPGATMILTEDLHKQLAELIVERRNGDSEVDGPAS